MRATEYLRESITGATGIAPEPVRFTSIHDDDVSVRYTLTGTHRTAMIMDGSPDVGTAFFEIECRSPVPDGARETAEKIALAVEPHVIGVISRYDFISEKDQQRGRWYGHIMWISLPTMVDMDKPSRE